ncbi:MAG TPA: amidohydrolase [Vicinamibacteria bacterium]|nr:amidohydrolase [Vicinamibacteria bacterium]
MSTLSSLAGVLALSFVIQTPRETADVLLVGPILTLDANRPRASALAIRGGRILAVGERSSLEPYVGPGTETIELPGIAVPGLADAHAHASGLGEQLATLDLRGLRKPEILARVLEVAARVPEGEWILGGGWDEGHFRPAEFPTAADLDTVTTRHPVVLDRIDGHSIWVNSRALAAASVSRATEDPQGGKLLRDSAGEPTGILVDHATAFVRRIVPEPSPAEAERRLRAALQEYARLGLTSVHDAGSDRETLLLYKKLLAEDSLPVRVYAMANGRGDLVGEILARGPEIALGEGRLTVRGFKVVLDGALGSRGAQLFEPYADAPSERGLETMGDEEFRDLIQRAAAKDFQVNAHAIGDRAVRRALDAFEAAGEEARRLRFRIEHASVIDPADRPRFAKLGVIASIQPMFAGEYARWSEDRVGPSRASSVLATRSLLDAGARLAFGTDYPASDSGDPLLNFYCAVTRRAADGTPREGFLPEERVSAETALRLLTEGPAFASFQEQDLGALTPGRYADLTVFSGDPLTTPPDELRELEVRMTIVGGRVVYTAGKALPAR